LQNHEIAGGRDLTIGGTAPKEGSSGRKVAVGAIASSTVNIVRMVVQLLLLPVMARLLGPEQFGLYALALPTVSLVSLLADGGIGGTLAREEESHSLVWSSAFWALLLMGVLLAVCTTAFGFFIGYLAAQPSLPLMIALLSTSLVFLTLSVVPAARLARRKNLGTGAGAELGATLFGAATAVIFAFQGAGAWSLAAQYVATYAVRAALLNFAAFQMPQMEFSFSVIHSHLVSGGFLISGRLFEYAGRMAESLLIDRMFGTAILGNYNFAHQIARYSTDALGSVTWLSLYVQALTTEKSRITVLHDQLCRLLGLTLFPVTFLAAAAAPELVSITLGPKWVDLSFMLQILLPLYALCSICSQSGAVLIAYNRVDLHFWCSVCGSVGRVLAVIVGFWTGLAGVLYCLIGGMLLYCLATRIASAAVMGSPIPMLKRLVRPALSSIVAAAALLVMVRTHETSVIWLLASLVAGTVVYLLTQALIDHKHLVEDLLVFRKMMSKERSV
jgi:O-antigen/teichoic acid export membrane protein